ncbi:MULTISPECIES: hypothetical protein [Microbacterium]|uniref:hypothetical protein n=1 Tax=Microbacterium TaxID=33882 RepID=UPI001E345FA1|nr:hypothetical protein [Microbacterium nymphoidis]MCD2499665.1 hypothetical protein [Microbacterium nymphoidis]
MTRSLLLAPPRENAIVHRRLARARMQVPSAAATAPGAPLAAAPAQPMAAVGLAATGTAQ